MGIFNFYYIGMHYRASPLLCTQVYKCVFIPQLKPSQYVDYELQLEYRTTARYLYRVAT